MVTEKGELGMTDRQQQIYDFIVAYIEENLYPPSVREIGDGVGLYSTSSVYEHLKTLENKGYIEIKENSPRAIKVKGYKFVKEEVAVNDGRTDNVNGIFVHADNQKTA